MSEIAFSTVEAYDVGTVGQSEQITVKEILHGRSFTMRTGLDNVAFVGDKPCFDNRCHAAEQISAIFNCSAGQSESL
jgi:hypothetical protein